MWLGSGAGGTWWTVKDPTLALLKGQAGRGFQKMLLSVPKNSRQLGIDCRCCYREGLRRRGAGEAEGPFTQGREDVGVTDKLRFYNSCKNMRPFSVGACLCQAEERDKPSENIV